MIHKENRVSFLNEIWIPNNPPIGDMTEGLLTQNNLNAKVDAIYNLGEWDTSSISLNLPENITNLIKFTS